MYLYVLEEKRAIHCVCRRSKSRMIWETAESLGSVFDNDSGRRILERSCLHRHSMLAVWRRSITMITMKTITLFALIVLGMASSIWGATFVYVSESGDNTIAIFSLNETNGDLSRVGEIDLGGAPGCLWLSPDRSRIYASVRSISQFATLAVDPNSGLLSLVATAPSAGSAAYIYPDKTGNWLLAAYYREGLVTVSQIVDGTVTGKPVQVIETGAKAHCIQTDAANNFAFVPHVGELNKVQQFTFDAATGELAMNSPSKLDGAEGAGPRHFQFHPNGKWAYLVNEQSKSVTHCDYDAARGTLTKRKTLSTHPDGWDLSEGSCADIEVSADGRFVYASNRGHDSIAVFRVDDATGELTSLGQTSTEKTPRSFNLIPDGENLLVAAGQGSNKLVVYRRDTDSGGLTPLKTYECGKSPAWVMGVKFP